MKNKSVPVLSGFTAVEKKRNGLSKIAMQAKLVLEQLGVLLDQAVGTQLRRNIYGGVALPQALFGG